MVGKQVKFRNGEICTIQQVRTNTTSYTTCNAKSETIEVKAGELVSYVLEFDDGEITLANIDEFEVI